MENQKMTVDEQREEMTLALLEFVKRATAKNATAEEVGALPAIARLLSEILC